MERGLSGQIRPCDAARVGDLDADYFLILGGDRATSATVVACPKPGACRGSMLFLHDAPDTCVAEACSEIVMSCLSTDDGPIPCEPDAGTPGMDEVEGLDLAVEGLDRVVVLHNLPAAPIGGSDCEAFAIHETVPCTR